MFIIDCVADFCAGTRSGFTVPSVDSDSGWSPWCSIVVHLRSSSRGGIVIDLRGSSRGRVVVHLSSNIGNMVVMVMLVVMLVMMVMMLVAT